MASLLPWVIFVTKPPFFCFVLFPSETLSILLCLKVLAPNDKYITFASLSINIFIGYGDSAAIKTGGDKDLVRFHLFLNQRGRSGVLCN